MLDKSEGEAARQEEKKKATGMVYGGESRRTERWMM